MPSDGDERRWSCGSAAVVRLRRVGELVREIGDPCLSRSPAKGNKMLKPDKWQSIFDNEGKASDFPKALKLIILGGVDPSIRSEVWEFLLGCYSLGSTAEYRGQLRMARRERYNDLIRECQAMHSSVGSGTLAHVVGSKVMDARTMSRGSGMGGEDITIDGGDRRSKVKKEADLNSCNKSTDIYPLREDYSSKSVDLYRVRESTEDIGCGSSTDMRCSNSCKCSCTQSGPVKEESPFSSESDLDFPALPFTNLFEKASLDGGCEMHNQSPSSKCRCRQEEMHSFHIDNYTDPVTESDDKLSIKTSCTENCDGKKCKSGAHRRSEGQNKQNCQNSVAKKQRVSGESHAAATPPSSSNGLNTRDDRVSEWLWTLHRIVVDVVRTDSHLEFYKDPRNVARMSDILAVYAWIDPATGYCQGMSDLLSPFVVLYEDNADAFWCFEMLIRRLRENFQMDGPTRVMKQLEALWKTLELTDSEIFAHLSDIGAESLHFAFRMLLVLFRRELSFDEALCMWEMMWAADFSETLTRNLEEDCLEPLTLHLPINSDEYLGDSRINVRRIIPETESSEHSNNEIVAERHNGVGSDSRYNLCGLTKASFWARHNDSPPTRNIDDELPVFCVAAILIINRQKIMRETQSMDDIIKMFNDNMLKISVRRCVRTAIKLRKKYLFKAKNRNKEASEQ